MLDVGKTVTPIKDIAPSDIMTKRSPSRRIVLLRRVKVLTHSPLAEWSNKSMLLFSILFVANKVSVSTIHAGNSLVSSTIKLFLYKGVKQILTMLIITWIECSKVQRPHCCAFVCFLKSKYSFNSIEFLASQSHATPKESHPVDDTVRHWESINDMSLVCRHKSEMRELRESVKDFFMFSSNAGCTTRCNLRATYQIR